MAMTPYRECKEKKEYCAYYNEKEMICELDKRYCGIKNNIFICIDYLKKKK